MKPGSSGKEAGRAMRVLLVLGALLTTSACASDRLAERRACERQREEVVRAIAREQTSCVPSQERVFVRDGAELPYIRWTAAHTSTRAVLIALHGMNDHSGRFASAACHWSKAGIVVYAYDQRGFGKTASRGTWPGTAVLVRDLVDFAEFVADSHPGVDVTVLGESMGAAVVLEALGQESPKETPKGRGTGVTDMHRDDLELTVDRAVVVAPSISPGPFRSAMLWVLTHTIPSIDVSVDDIRWLTKDKNLPDEVVGDTCFDNTVHMKSLWGLIKLSDQASKNTHRIKKPILIIYGGDDKLIPPDLVSDTLARIPENFRALCFRPFSGHFLLHERFELEAWEEKRGPEPVWDGIADWALDEDAEVPGVCR